MLKALQSFILLQVGLAVAINVDEDEIIDHIVQVLDVLIDFKVPYLEAHDQEAFEYLVKKAFTYYKKMKETPKTDAKIRNRLATLQAAMKRATWANNSK